jgi:hypothetical protein
MHWINPLSMTLHFRKRGVSHLALGLAVVVFLATGCGSSGGNSDTSPEGNGDTTPPNNPSNLTATPGDKTVQLAWEGVEADDLAGYNVYRSTSESFNADDKVASTISATQFSDDEVSNGTDYFYIVTAEDGSGNESNSSNGVIVRPPFEAAPDPR